ncbi:MAG: hypothetical protein KF729_32835 [Sandaracinaceae bacterium]|nr:hypothetical protein [Sandaracinaceae bacterium]
MAAKWDNTPPQNLVILACAVGSALLLFVLKFGFDAYYDGMRARTVGEQQTRYDDLAPLREREAGWQGQLERGNRMPLRAAMSQLGAQGRAADPAISPERPAQMNTGPLEGWTQLPQEVPQPEPVRAEPTGARGLSPEALQQLQEALRQLVPSGGAE